MQAQQLKSPRQSSSSLCASEKKTLAHAQVLQRSPSLLGCLVCVEQFAVFAGSSWQVHKQRNRPCRPWLPDFKILPCFSASAAFAPGTAAQRSSMPGRHRLHASTCSISSDIIYAHPSLGISKANTQLPEHSGITLTSLDRT